MNKSKLHFRLMERTIKLNLQLHPIPFDSCFHFSPWLWHFHVINRWPGLWLFSTLVYLTCSSSIFSPLFTRWHLGHTGPCCELGLLWLWQHVLSRPSPWPGSSSPAEWCFPLLGRPADSSLQSQPLSPLFTPSAPPHPHLLPSILFFLSKVGFLFLKQFFKYQWSFP